MKGARRRQERSGCLAVELLFTADVSVGGEVKTVVKADAVDQFGGLDVVCRLCKRP